MAEVFKRPSLPLVPREAKRPRLDNSDAFKSLQQQQQQNQPEISRRNSSLQHPIMLLTGHEGEIYAARFSPDGTCLASSGYDMKILFWNVYGDCDNFSTLGGHKGAVMDLHFSSDSSQLYTCSTDKTIRIWDMETGVCGFCGLKMKYVCRRKFRSHTDLVNSCHPARRGPDLICSGSDDGTVMIHDSRRKDPVKKFENPNKYQITAVTFNDTAEQVISGGIDNSLKIWDLRKDQLLFVMPGHSDIITSVSLNPEGTHVLSNSMDCTARIWDIRPYASSQRCQKVLYGHQHNFEKNLIKCSWSPDGHKVSCGIPLHNRFSLVNFLPGSSDRYVYVWEVQSKRIMYKLPGHQGSVNAVDFHPKEPILLSAGSDKRIFIGELGYS